MRWYAAALGGTPAVADGFRYLDVGGVRVEVVPADAKVGSGAAGSVVYWRAADLDATLARLRAAGAVVCRGPLAIEAGQWMAQVRDPWGNCVGVCGPRSTAPSGGTS